MTQVHPNRTARACVWCGAPFDDTATHLGLRTRCAACNAATTDPQPTPEELSAAYGDWYRPQEERRFFFAVDSLLARTRGLLAARLDRTAPPGPILDVGAGDGVLIDALRARGRDATGLERNPNRPDLHDTPLSEIEGEWAAVVFWHSLEHLTDPGAAIKHAASLLPSGGVLAVAVPNNDSIQAERFGDDWLHLDIPRHLVHLGTGSLELGLREAGFTVRHVGFFRGGQTVIGWLDGLVGRLPGRPDLYQALRRKEARGFEQPPLKRILAIVAAVALFPVAAIAALAESAVRRGGTVYMEATRD